MQYFADQLSQQFYTFEDSKHNRDEHCLLICSPHTTVMIKKKPLTTSILQCVNNQDDNNRRIKSHTHQNFDKRVIYNLVRHHQSNS